MAGVAVVLSGAVGAFVLGLGGDPGGSTPRASLALSVDAGDDAVRIEHAGGDPIDVSRATVRIEIDGQSLAHQPPVPFVGATGFDGAPAGPFNAAADQRWTVGESAGLWLASTNAPPLQPGSRVVVRVVVDGAPVATVEATAG